MSAFNVGKKVSAAVRILQRKRDASARATHLVGKKDPLITYEKALLSQATGGKFPSVTFNERKQMSTKTSIKRIALVAAAALTLGGFSAVSASATTPLSGTKTGFTITAGGSTYTLKATGVTSTTPGDSTVEGAANAATATVGTAVTVRYYVATDATAYSPSVTGGVFLTANNPSEGTPAGFLPGATAFYVLGQHTGAYTDGEYIEVKVFSNTAGAAVVTIGSATATITYGAAATISSQYSTAYISDSTTAATADVAGLSVSSSVAIGGTARVALIAVTLKNSSIGAMTGQGLTAAISGPGLLGMENVASLGTSSAVATGRNISTAAASGNFAYFHVTVFADGSNGVSTITLTSGTTTIGTKTITFVGSPKTATAVQNLKVLGAGKTTPGAGAGALTSATDASAATTVATLPAIVANVRDSNGNGVAGTVKITSSDSSVIVTNGCTAVAVSAIVVAGTYNCQVNGAVGAASGKSATVTFSVLNSTTGLYDIVATPLTFTIGGSLKTESIATDATTYTNLGPLKLVLSGKDSSGNAAYDQDVTFFGGSVTSSTQLGGAALPTASTSVALIGGTKTLTGLYAPSISGDFTISGLDGVTGTTTLSATASAGGIDANAGLALDAANAATDAANNAYDEAQNATQAASDALAAVTALSAQVSALIATVKSLAAMVAKIKAKVKA